MRFFYAILACSSFSSFVNAAPWVEANNIFLRADIQLLADNQVIKAPINHYPLMWSDIAADLEQAELNTLNEAVTRSYQRVIFHLNQAKSSERTSSIKLAAATDRPKFQHFGSDQKEKTELTTSKTFIGDKFSARLEVHNVSSPADDKNFRLDGSYMAYQLGNWNIIGGAVPMWWGPGWDSALLMSTNSRPVPGISINRQQALAFETPWLSWIGPWSFTTFMGQLEDKGRTISNTLLWSSRLSVKPFSSLELGFSRSTMWGGDGRGNGLSDFWDVVTPSESDNKVDNPTDVNDLGAIDFRWNTSLLEQNFALYYEMGFEDYGISSITPSKRSHLVGIDTDFFFGQSLYSVFLEASDTYHAECECIYEHDVYRSGYRYRGEEIGSTYGNNGNSVTLGVIAQPDNDTYWQSSLAFIQLNKNNENDIVPDGDLSYQKIIEWRSSYRFVWANSRWQLGAILRKTDINGLTDSGLTADGIKTKSDNDVEVSLSWEYKL